MYYKVREFGVRTNIGNFKGTLFKLKYHHEFKIKYKQISIIVDDQEYITNLPTFKLTQSIINTSIINNCLTCNITFDECIHKCTEGINKCIENRLSPFETKQYTFDMENCCYDFMLPLPMTIQNMVEEGNKDLCKRYEQTLTIDNKIEDVPC